MRIRWWQSLRFRIALVIFLLEAVMLSVVLWQTQSYADDQAQQLIKEQDEIALQLLLEESNQAMLTLEFGQLSDSFVRAANNPHILNVSLSDQRELVVASNHLASLGKPFTHDPKDRNTYLREIELEDFSGPIGKLQVVFSSDELQQVYRETLQLGMTVGLSGMLVIALAGIGFGHLLTRKLDRLSRHAELVADGANTEPIQFQGRDEVSVLATSVNRMITALRSNVAKMRDMAYRDELTGLANRPRFHQRLERAVNSARRHHQQHALLYLDLDQFKVVNDTCGHDAGDRLLAELAGTLGNSLRGRDTVARIGGDEFGILLESVQPEEAALVAEKIRRAVADFRFVDNERIFQIGVSIGVVMIDEHSGGMKELLSLSDMACYAAKERGRNAIEFATADDQALAERNEQMQWVPQIIAAIEDDRFELVRQRIGSTSQPQTAFGWELLLRLHLPDGTVHSPAHFIAAAERFDLMPRLDRHVCQSACRAIAAGKLGDDAGRVFINLSAQTLADADFPAYFQSQVDNCGLDPKRFCFEITETAAINNLNNALSFIDQLRKLGCMFALDDFGSGMCSFNYLKRLNVDFVKIDGSFIEKMLENPLDERIIGAIVDIAGTAHFRTIGEFVEQPEQLQRLNELGVDFVQGYLVHKPEPLD